MQSFTISNDPAWFEAWPDVALTAGGRLVCVFSECVAHRDRSFTRVVWTVSDDRGRSWSAKRHLVTGDAERHWWDCAQITRLRDGRLVIICGRATRGEAKPKDHYSFLFFSEDDGETFGPPVPTPIYGVMPDRVTELPDGRWLVATHMTDPAHGKQAQYIWRSDDAGRGWVGPERIASDPDLNLCEGSVLVLPEGTLVCFERENSGLGRHGYKVISHDRGESWHGPYPVPIPGCHRPKAMLLQSGNVLVGARLKQGGRHAWGTNQLTLAVHMDADSARATRWGEQTTRLFPLSYDRSPISDTGYTGSVQFDDGEIYMVNYLVDDAPRAQIRGYSFREEQIVLPATSGAAPAGSLEVDPADVKAGDEAQGNETGT